MSTRVRVDLRGSAERSYEILIQPGVLGQVAGLVRQRFPHCTVALITDHTVRDLYADAILSGFESSPKQACHLYTFPAGEASKTRETKAMLEDAMFANRHDRKTVIIALGGGVTGDLAGYCAATYMRGVPFVQVPTTLLAQVDSSVGGKTGVDLPAGKNLVGAFWQPSAVYADTTVLQTLPGDEFLSGLGEIVKHALMFSPGMIEMLVTRHVEIMQREPVLMADLVAQNCAIKAHVVSADETETGLRKTLNFGHTAAHALELVSDFGIAHGIAVLAGMLVELRAAVHEGYLAAGHEQVMRDCIRIYLPELPKIRQFDPGRLVEAMLLDKKNESGRIHCSVPTAPGTAPEDPGWTRPFQPAVLTRALDEVFAQG